MLRTAIPATLAVALLLAPSAFAKNGVTPLTPKTGASVPVGQPVTFKLKAIGPSAGVFVHVCKSKRKDADGMICSDEVIGKAKKKSGGRYEYKAKFFDYPEFWLNNPGTYYWQAYRTDCSASLDDCKAEGEIVKFKVG